MLRACGRKAKVGKTYDCFVNRTVEHSMVYSEWLITVSTHAQRDIAAMLHNKDTSCKEVELKQCMLPARLDTKL